MDNILAIAFIFFALYGLCHLIYLSIRSIRRGIEFKTYRNSDYTSIQMRIRRYSRGKSIRLYETEEPTTLEPAIRNKEEG